LLRQLTKYLTLAEGENKGKYPYANCLLIEGEQTAMIDSCPGRETIEAIDPNKVDIIINTHFHIDHIGLNYLFEKATVYIHHLAAQPLKSKKVFEEYTGFNFFDHLEEFLAQVGYDRALPVKQPIKELKDSELIDLGGVTARTVHLPGHCPGHCGFLFEEEGILFSGDIDLTSFGPWYGNRTSSIDDFIASTKRIIELNPRILIPSHSAMLTEQIPQRLKEYLAVIEQRDFAILEALDQPKTLEELVEGRIIFKKRPEPQELYRIFERFMIAKHLERLRRQNAIGEEDGFYLAS